MEAFARMSVVVHQLKLAVLVVITVESLYLSGFVALFKPKLSILPKIINANLKNYFFINIELMSHKTYFVILKKYQRFCNHF